MVVMRKKREKRRGEGKRVRKWILVGWGEKLSFAVFWSFLLVDWFSVYATYMPL